MPTMFDFSFLQDNLLYLELFGQAWIVPLVLVFMFIFILSRNISDISTLFLPLLVCFKLIGFYIPLPLYIPLVTLAGFAFILSGLGTTAAGSFLTSAGTSLGKIVRGEEHYASLLASRQASALAQQAHAQKQINLIGKEISPISQLKTAKFIKQQKHKGKVRSRKLDITGQGDFISLKDIAQRPFGDVRVRDMSGNIVPGYSSSLVPQEVFKKPKADRTVLENILINDLIKKEKEKKKKKSTNDVGFSDGSIKQQVQL